MANGKTSNKKVNCSDCIQWQRKTAGALVRSLHRCSLVPVVCFSEKRSSTVQEKRITDVLSDQDPSNLLSFIYMILLKMCLLKIKTFFVEFFFFFITWEQQRGNAMEVIASQHVVQMRIFLVPISEGFAVS